MTPARGTDSPPLNGLMLAFAFTLPYHVLRTASAAGLRIHVLGGGPSRGLRASRFCRSYCRSEAGGDPGVLLAEIRTLTRRHAIDLILPSDDVSTRLLAALGDRLPVRCVKLPSVATFDLLNDKGNFTRFCRENGLRAPEGWLFDSTAALRRALEKGEIALPLTVKPTNRSGGVGVVHLRGPGDLALLDTIDCRPLLAQRHVTGASVSITVLCENGRVIAHIGQERDAARFRVLPESDLLATVSRLAALTRYSGVANFDAVLSAEDGLGYLVECNPRFWYSIYLAMIAGLNFVGLSLRPPDRVVTLDRGEVRLSFRRIVTRPWRASRLDWRFLFYNLRDPLAYLVLRGHRYDDREVAVPAAQMAAPRAEEERPLERMAAGGSR